VVLEVRAVKVGDQFPYRWGLVGTVEVALDTARGWWASGCRTGSVGRVEVIDFSSGRLLFRVDRGGVARFDSLPGFRS